ncbi:protein TolR [Roseospirillum parvum]|uniref:Biopolymer transport protein TolR n=1 Tax=Roseospirillum parvum TaxID=83401 RepID=A0A1G7XN90_9PROT|nr:protein TolR [Roseospirillum parvum]SDG85674.1 biopolymer transport protein TolR [Roseospirillum parvum]
MGGFVTKGRVGHRRAYQPMAEINVTPMVDVMLVLLVIFMVTAPLLTTGVEVNRPQARTPALGHDDKALTVSIRADGSIFVQERAVELEQVGPLLNAILQENPEARVYVSGDQANSYGRVMAVMGAIYQAGIAQVALITDPPGSRPEGQ